MSPPSKRFKPIQRIVGNKERQAANALGESLKVRQQEEERLRELRSYHAEYLQRYGETTRNGASAAQLRDYQVFLDRLEQAIHEQERVAGRARQQCDQNKDQWRERYTRSQVISKVVERLKDGERRAEDKQEQIDQDERNQHKR